MEQDSHGKVPPEDPPLIFNAEPSELNTGFKPVSDILI
jgi:hypothetical protein